MTVTPAVREQVRQRARYACEYCDVTESDSGGELSVDHFQPKTKGGEDTLDNLLYCCPRCNQYKLDYWPTSSRDPVLWNPRREPASHHFLELDNQYITKCSRRIDKSGGSSDPPRAIRDLLIMAYFIH
jgi:5-methylcytosine-specific restriction endonuclease McrA